MVNDYYLIPTRWNITLNKSTVVFTKNQNMRNLFWMEPKHLFYWRIFWSTATRGKLKFLMKTFNNFQLHTSTSESSVLNN